MRRSDKHALVDMALFLLVLSVAISGIVLWQVLPHGGFMGGRNPLYGATFLSLSRHMWNDLHFYSSLIFAGVMIIHFFLHIRWLKGVTRRYSKILKPVPVEDSLTTRDQYS